jgi:hypothetical protein
MVGMVCLYQVMKQNSQPGVSFPGANASATTSAPTPLSSGTSAPSGARRSGIHNPRDEFGDDSE